MGKICISLNLCIEILGLKLKKVKIVAAKKNLSKMDK